MTTDAPERRAPSPARVATIAALPVALVAGVVAFWGLGGFPSGPSSAVVPAEAPQLDPSPAAMCRALVSRLPEELGGLHRRQVTAGGEQNAAFGDPAILLSCGGAAPAIPPDAQFLGLSDVCWFTQEQSRQTVWHSVDRQVPLRVVVPKDADGSWLVNLSPAIVATIPTAPAGESHC
ncbi:DUF3515 domain-containing protein [Dactylosporangium sp. CS-047395]|uniref:DUF3515 domain-containing protein n=1 Tax=Dactylosporangium sp. CS-047395 TaxID=3239936 RepID=UPI003D8EA2AF